MSNDHREHDDFESSLANMRPSRSQVDRAELLFRAGQESAITASQRTTLRHWCWPLSTVAMTIVSVGLAWQLAQPVEPQIVERVRVVERVVSEPQRQQQDGALHAPYELASAENVEHFASITVSPRHYVQQRQLALNIGVEAMTGAAAFQTPSVIEGTTYRDMRTSLGYEDEPNRTNSPKSES